LVIVAIKEVLDEFTDRVKFFFILFGYEFLLKGRFVAFVFRLTSNIVAECVITFNSDESAAFFVGDFGVFLIW